MRAKLQPSTAKITVELSILEAQVIADACNLSAAHSDPARPVFNVLHDTRNTLYRLVEESQKTD